MEYCTVQDVIDLFRALTADEMTKAEKLIPVVCARLRTAAAGYGKDLDEMVLESDDLAIVARSVTVDIVARNLMTPTSGAPMTQYSESALGYTASGTFLNPGGGVFIKKAELKALGITGQRYGSVSMIPEGRRC